MLQKQTRQFDFFTKNYDGDKDPVGGTFHQRVVTESLEWNNNAEEIHFDLKRVVSPKESEFRNSRGSAERYFDHSDGNGFLASWTLYEFGMNIWSDFYDRNGIYTKLMMLSTGESVSLSFNCNAIVGNWDVIQPGKACRKRFWRSLWLRQSLQGVNFFQQKKRNPWLHVRLNCRDWYNLLQFSLQKNAPKFTFLINVHGILCGNHLRHGPLHRPSFYIALCSILVKWTYTLPHQKEKISLRKIFASIRAYLWFEVKKDWMEIYHLGNEEAELI